MKFALIEFLLKAQSEICHQPFFTINQSKHATFMILQALTDASIFIQRNIPWPLRGLDNFATLDSYEKILSLKFRLS